jgi:hypothetical protein
LNPAARGGLGIFTSLVLAFFLGMMSVPSIANFLEFLKYDELSSYLIDEVCVVGFLVISVLCFFINIANGFIVLKSRELPRVLRASWFLILYPVILWTFALSSAENGFAVFGTFGWPLFLLGMVAYPTAAFIVHGELKAMIAENALSIQCFNCSAVFLMHRTDEWIRCPYCGEINMNPLPPEARGPRRDGEDTEQVEDKRIGTAEVEETSGLED